jgi:hypothetical protein
MKNFTRYIALISILLFCCSALHSEITPKALKILLIGKSLPFGENSRWEFNSQDTLRLNIISEKLLSSKKNKNAGKEVLAYFQSYSTEKFNWKTIEGKILVRINNNEDFLNAEIISCNSYSLNEIQFYDLKLSEKLWKNFVGSLIADKKDNLLKCFHFPLRMYGSTIEDESLMKQNYYAYFSDVKKLVFANTLFPFPNFDDYEKHSSTSVEFSATKMIDDDEEHPSISLRLVAHKFGDQFLFDIFELGN